MTSYTHRDVWRIATPLILSNITVPLLGLVDTAVVGHLDHPRYLGAVAVGGTIFSFLYMGFNFLRMGTTGLAAQALGKDDTSGLRAILGQAFLTALGLGVAFILLQGWIGEAALRLIGAEADVSGEAARYFGIRVWSAPAALANFAVIGWFIGMQNGRAPLMILLAANLTNIFLDVLFVTGFGWTTGGVALASLIAEYTGLAVGLLSLRRELSRHPGRWQESALLDRERFRRLFSVNANLFLRTMSLMFAFAFLTAQSARQGGIILAANAVLLNLQYFMAYGLDGLANAAEALVGKAIGARSPEALRRAVSLAMSWSAGVAVLFSGIYLFLGPQIVALLTDLDSVRATTGAFLAWMVVSPLLSVWSFTFDGIFVGATHAREMRNSMLASTFLIYLPTWYLTRPLGNHGLWLSFMIFMVARGITMALLYPRIERGVQPRGHAA